MRIVINPGHSEQYDPGAVAADGLTEAWVVTQIARQMGALGGYELKRQGRLLLPMLLGLRVNKPDLLVSLHCNAPPAICTSATPTGGARSRTWRCTANPSGWPPSSPAARKGHSRSGDW